MAKMKLGGMEVSDSSLPYVIAEIGVNHEGSLERAKELVSLAKKGGASAAKFQSYKAETLASRNSPSYWDTTKEPTTSQYELFKKYDSFGEKEYRALAEHCRKEGIDFISTPFDDAAVEFLFDIVPFYKVASADITNVPFLRRIASRGKPIVLSTGAATMAEIDSAVQEINSHGCSQLALLHCVLNYPTPNEYANLNMICGLRAAYPDVVVGYSDHTLPDPNMLVLTAAYLKGARIIEKHFTYDKSLPGNDHYHAMDVNDLSTFLENMRMLSSLGGDSFKHPLESEEISRKNARRSIVLKTNVSKGTILTSDMLTYKRPAFGVSPLHWDDVIGRRTLRDLTEDEVLQWGFLE